MGNSQFQRQISPSFVKACVRGVFNVVLGSVHSSGLVYTFHCHSQLNDNYILVDIDVWFLISFLRYT
jgi:hypothetical protein